MLVRVQRSLGLQRALRTYVRTASTHSLVFLEHNKGVIDSGSLSAVTAASKLGGTVTGLIVGGQEHVSAALDKAKRIKGLTSVLHAASPDYVDPVPETLSPLIHKLLTDGSTYTHVVSPPTSLAKSTLPRVAAILDLPMVSEALSIEHDDSSGTTTFTRPIYAGNAIATVRAPGSVPVKFFTIRATSFDAAPYDDAQEVELKQIEAVSVSDSPTEHLETTITKSDRPELGVASRVVSGGRPLKDAQTFQSVMYPLADVLGAAVGASRAAVDAGYADNSLQVGQTGKVVAPELYIAVGISGAIQHLAGMKDSKLIIAINKDPEAPIFQVADVGLVGDLYQVVPELVEKLKQSK